MSKWNVMRHLILPIMLFVGCTQEPTDAQITARAERMVIEQQQCATVAAQLRSSGRMETNEGERICFVTKIKIEETTIPDWHFTIQELRSITKFLSIKGKE